MVILEKEDGGMVNWKKAMVVVMAVAVLACLSAGCGDKKVKKEVFIKVFSADFSAEPEWGGAPLNVQFADESTSPDNNIDTWEWDFENDGTIDSTEQSPSHTYTEQGTYTVSLTVTSSQWNDTKTKVDFITVVEGKTITVPGDFPSIQEAIDNASDGDRVVIANGSYEGDWNDGLRRNKNLELRGKKITVESENGPNNCTIECRGVGRGFNIHEGEDKYTVIKGLTIRGGKSSGGGLYIENASPTIIGNIITKNKGYLGGGIHCKNASPKIKDNTIDDNNADGGRGGGIYCCEGAKPEITGNTITNNLATMEALGAGICCENSSPQIINNTIENNEANSITQGKGRGGGIFCSNSDATIKNNTVSNNEARYGGGIWCGGSGSDNAVITGNTMDHNTVVIHGGGMCIQSASPTVTWNIFTNNYGGDDYGGGIIIMSEGTNPTVTHNIIKGNSANKVAGGIGLWMKANAWLESNLIADNHANKGGGGLEIDQQSKATIVNCTFVNNSVADGCGGGAFFTWGIPGDGPVTLVNCIFWGNTASGGGKQLYISCDANVSYCDIQDKDGSGLGISGFTVNLGDGIIDQDPLLDGDFRLQTGSPCIDAGDSDSVLFDKDLDGNARIAGGSVDVGAYEKQ
jgi:parallel beta-helix repeat protein